MRPWIICSLLTSLLCCPAFAQQEIPEKRGPDVIDVEYSRKIHEYTTDPSFLTEWVDHLPASKTVPSPAAFTGHVIGAPDVLTPPEKINDYFRELAKSSKRLRVFSMGKSHGGREMIVAAIADAELLDELDSIKAANHELADPRRTSEERAREIAGSTPPVYWITAGLHSPETGPPEMVMELAYRLVVSEQEHIRAIRGAVITLISPVLEMDGRARMVDWYQRYLTKVTDLEDSPPRMAPYWGDYTAHDNNRDGLQQSQPLTRNYVDLFHEFLPVVSLDLHESVPLLYVSMGTGPYNDSIDPITVTEWQWISGYEVSECTKLGLRGVWTWGFYTGWYPGYLLWVTNNHNAVGRFYETFGNGHPGTFLRELSQSRFADKRTNSRQWYRPWPPEKELRWSLRNNTNYMQTGVLASLGLVARNGDTLLYNFWKKSHNSLEKGRREKPSAFHIPAAQRDRGALQHLLGLLERHRIEVHRATAAAALDGDIRVTAGDFVVRMDQPYRNFARTLLAQQTFPKTAALTPYDDVSWSLGLMLGVEVQAVDDPGVLDVPMEALGSVPDLAGSAEPGQRWVIDHRGQPALASLRFALGGETEVEALAEAWEGHPAGSLIIETDAERMAELTRRFHLDAKALTEVPSVRTVEVGLPRVGLFHTWRYTQDSGWARYTLEELGVPYTLINKDHLRRGELRGGFDVIVIPSQGGLGFKGMVHGIDSKWGPMPYTRTEAYPSHGVIDSTDDLTGGMGFRGLENLHEFVKEGGVLVCLGSGGILPAEGGIVREVSSTTRSTPGSHLTTRVLRPEHPLAWGYPEVTHVFRGNLPVYDVREYRRGYVVMQFGTKTWAEADREADEKADIPVEEPDGSAAADRTSANGNGDPDEKTPFLRSGLLEEPGALARKPALVLEPVGKGWVVFFSWNPLHRHQNHHDFAFFLNTLLFHDDFPAQIPTRQEMQGREQPSEKDPARDD